MCVCILSKSYQSIVSGFDSIHSKPILHKQPDFLPPLNILYSQTNECISSHLHTNANLQLPANSVELQAHVISIFMSDITMTAIAEYRLDRTYSFPRSNAAILYSEIILFFEDKLANYINAAGLTRKIFQALGKPPAHRRYEMKTFRRKIAYQALIKPLIYDDKLYTVHTAIYGGGWGVCFIKVVCVYVSPLLFL